MPINNCEQLNKERNQIRWYSCWWSYRLYFISWFIWNEIVSIKRFSFDELSDVFSKNQYFINSLKIDEGKNTIVNSALHVQTSNWQTNDEGNLFIDWGMIDSYLIKIS